uniref:Tachykinin n=1 Tax=Octopus kaurna TaxID=243731 RepID=B6Z1Y6_OCTKA|nr:tachykinin [Octopus kaurna]
MFKVSLILCIIVVAGLIETSSGFFEFDPDERKLYGRSEVDPPSDDEFVSLMGRDAKYPRQPRPRHRHGSLSVISKRKN